MFAKLFKHPEAGQILVVRDQTDEEKPGVSFRIKPEGIGLSAIWLVFEDSDRGDEDADSAFDTITEEQAIAAVKPIVDMAALHIEPEVGE